MMYKSMREAPTQEEYQRLMDVCSGLYQLGDSPAFYAGGQIDVPGGAPFQVFDLNGMMGVLLELNSCIDNHLRLIAALSQGRMLDLTSRRAAFEEKAPEDITAEAVDLIVGFVEMKA